MAQPAMAEPQPAVLAVAAQQDLGHCQTDQLRIRQPRLAAAMPASWVGSQPLVDGDIGCDDEVVETGARGASPEVDVATATPTLGGLVSLVTARYPHSDSESII